MYLSEKKRFISTFLSKNADALKALENTVSNLPETQHAHTLGGYAVHLNGLLKRLTQVGDVDVDVGAQVCSCMGLYVDANMTRKLLDPANGLDSLNQSTLPKKSKFALEVAKVFRPLIADIKKLNVHEKQEAALFKQLNDVVQDLQRMLPQGDASFVSVKKTCDALAKCLSPVPFDLEQTKDNLVLLLKNMGTVDLYKPWNESKTFSEMAGYIMHALESAIRLLLECVYICSASDRENYFVKGPKKEIFERFNTALGNLQAVETGLKDEMEQKAGLNI